MRHTLTSALIAVATLMLSGCAFPDHVLFVTKTSIGIDFDSKPATASLAYDRIEGYVAPRYDNGEIPAVVASVKSDGKIFNPQIRQVYATGDAALIATNGMSAGNPQSMKGTRSRKLMFFGTTTTTGVKVGFTTGLPDSFVFGFKRKEFSYIPLATTGSGGDAQDVYPSVLASIDTAANVSADGKTIDTALTNSQFFATGHAARKLAETREVREGFKAIATADILRQQAEAVRRTLATDGAVDALLEEVLGGFYDPNTTAEQKTTIVAMTQAVGLDPDNTMTVSNFDQKLTRNASTSTPVDAAVVEKKLQSLRGKIKILLNQ